MAIDRSRLTPAQTAALRKAGLLRDGPAMPPAASSPVDSADILYGLLQLHAPDLLQGCEREHRFAAAAGRGWRFDLAWPGVQPPLAVEMDGGRWKPGGGRHGSDADHEKGRAALRLGWRVLHYSPAELRRNPLRVIAEIRAAMEPGKENQGEGGANEPLQD